MADTKQIEMVAEDLISHFLQRNGILVAKPKFDQEGGDLIAMLSVADGARFCRIQSKGRSLYKKGDCRSIAIPRSYVTDDFIVMIYIDDGTFEKTLLYCCFAEHIGQLPWVLSNDEKQFVLNLTGKNFESVLQPFRVTEDSVDRIKAIIKKADVQKELMYMLDQQRIPIPDQLGTRTFDVEKMEGQFVPVITNPVTQHSFVGTPCPGNPADFDYDPSTDTWTRRYF